MALVRDTLPRSASLRSRSDPSTSSLHCCCGRPDCVYLKKNCSILETVEKDVHTAAQIGQARLTSALQALLARHEAYMADAERDRLHLTDRIERLEDEKQNLEAANATTVHENRNLLDQLEALNTTVSDSETRIKALEANLISSQQNVRRLEAVAARAVDAERHIALLEEEQDRLYKELQITTEDARSHVQRFKEAQRGILDMQDQLERMEEEARRENARHAEVAGRMDRQREMDKQLDVAVGRLKGTATSKSLQRQTNANKIVGHFVRDLLEDNANLQLAMAELREMLMTSNDEIQSLQDQLLHHQPVVHQDVNRSGTLESELGLVDQSPKLLQELHVHHHYHFAGAAKRHDARKWKKRRQCLLPGTTAAPVTSTHASIDSLVRREPVASCDGMASMTLGANAGNPSSLEPLRGKGSTPRNSAELCRSPDSSPCGTCNAMFDNTYTESDLMPSPTTTFDPMSPTWRSPDCKRSSDGSFRSLQLPGASRVDVEPSTPPGQQSIAHFFQNNTIHEEDEGANGHSQQRRTQPPLLRVEGTCSPKDSFTDDSDCSLRHADVCARIARASSHESIISLSGGLDVHTLKSRPKQMTLRRLGGADAVVTGVTARPTLASMSIRRSNVSLRDHFASLHTSQMVYSSSQTSSCSSSSPQTSSPSLSRLAGWRPWASATRSVLGGARLPLLREKDENPSRTPGINQPGAIPGFHQYWATQGRRGAPAQVTAKIVDHDALLEGLQE